MGSVQFRNSHRGQLVARYHPDNKGLVIVTDEKGSLLNQRGDPFAFRRIGTQIQYVRDFDNPFEPKEATSGTPSVKEAKQFLMKNCYGIFIDRTILIARAISQGISERTLDRAKQELTESKALTTRASKHNHRVILYGIYDEEKNIYDPEEDE
jgi:hypothetical protein